LKRVKILKVAVQIGASDVVNKQIEAGADINLVVIISTSLVIQDNYYMKILYAYF